MHRDPLEPTGFESSKPPHRGFLTNLWHLTLEAVALFTLYSLAAHTVGMVASLVGDTDQRTQPITGAVAPVGGAGITVTLPDPVAEVIIICIVLGVLTYIVLKWICEQKWVQEKVDVKKCWTEVKWYNPWSWVKAIVCTIVEVLKWILKWICKAVELVVVVLVITCIVVTLIAIFA